MTLKDLKADHDPLEIYYDEDDKSDRKKKKKKDKKKKKKHKDGGGITNRDAYKESLKELSRSKLHDRLIELGIDTRGIDTDSKKAMRKAILKKVYGDNDVLPAGDVKTKKHKDRGDERKITSRDDLPPHYYDEDTRDFVIRDAIDAEDITCFEAMQSLGAMRKSKRKDDGFGELMMRLTEKITATALEDKESTREVIDVTDFRVVEDKPEQKQLAAPKQKRKN